VSTVPESFLGVVNLGSWETLVGKKSLKRKVICSQPTQGWRGMGYGGEAVVNPNHCKNASQKARSRDFGEDRKTHERAKNKR